MIAAYLQCSFTFTHQPIVNLFGLLLDYYFTVVFIILSLVAVPIERGYWGLCV